MMKRIFSQGVVLVSILLASMSWAVAGEVQRYTFHSEVLGKDYPYLAYVPDGYGAEDESFPVVYLLHGSGGNETDWSRYGAVENVFDELVDKGEIPPSIVIMPGSNSWWSDGANEPAETAFIEELIPEIDAQWRTIAARDGRLIGGISAGGYGAANIALRYPEYFAAVMAFSPAVYMELPPARSSAWSHPAFQSPEGGFDEAIWRKLNTPARLKEYVQQSALVPFYIISGDRDHLDIAAHSAELYRQLSTHQPAYTEFRLFEGGHEWSVWRDALPDALRFAFQFVSLDAPTSAEGPWYQMFEGEWALKDDRFSQVWDGKTLEELAIPNHRTNCRPLNTKASILCIVRSPGLQGHILWTEKDDGEFVHLSHFGERRLGQGEGRILPNGDLQIKVTFSDEPTGTYRRYTYEWVSANEYRMVSTQVGPNHEETGNWYGGHFIRTDPREREKPSEVER